MIFFATIISYLEPTTALFRIALLACQKSPPTFAVPNGKWPTGNLKTQVFRKGKDYGTLRTSQRVIPAELAAKREEKEIFQVACRIGNAHRTFAPRFNRKRLIRKRRNEELKNFRFKFGKSKSFLTFALPITNRACKRQEKSLRNSSHGYTD
jgi:hypothetical protein